jgi:hypothetical protein
MGILGIGPAGAARILADVGDIARFPRPGALRLLDQHRPNDASSGEHTRHRLSRAGSRRLNHVLYLTGIVQMRHDTDGRAYYRRKLAESKTRSRPCAAYAGGCPKWSTLSSSPTPQPGPRARTRRAREDTPRGDSAIQRGRPTPGHRHFGSVVTSRTTEGSHDGWRG